MGQAALVVVRPLMCGNLTRSIFRDLGVDCGESGLAIDGARRGCDHQLLSGDRVNQRWTNFVRPEKAPVWNP
jgi:hypothetical protein